MIFNLIIWALQGIMLGHVMSRFDHGSADWVTAFGCWGLWGLWMLGFYTLKRKYE